MTTILITGATGFVGGHALEALMRRPGLTLVAACRDPARLPPACRPASRARCAWSICASASSPGGATAWACYPSWRRA